MVSKVVTVFAVLFLSSVMGENVTSWAQTASTMLEGGYQLQPCTKVNQPMACGGTGCGNSYPKYVNPAEGDIKDSLPNALWYLPCSSKGCNNKNVQYNQSYQCQPN